MHYQEMRKKSSIVVLKWQKKQNMTNKYDDVQGENPSDVTNASARAAVGIANFLSSSIHSVA